MATHQMGELSPSNASILHINTTGDDSCVCLVTERTRSESAACTTTQNICILLPHDQRRAESLLLTIDELLKKQLVKPRELVGIIVVTGPGSFTGTKVGITVANTLAWATNLPIAGIIADKLDNNYKKLSELIHKSNSRIILPTLPPPSITFTH